LQQKALGLRWRVLGNLIVVLGVPGLAQLLDWTAHRITSAAVTGRATIAISLFATLSALFHLHVMRNGAFLTGTGRSLIDDFRRMPRLIGGLVVRPFALLLDLTSGPTRSAESNVAIRPGPA
jgi:hypothetical protein